MSAARRGPPPVALAALALFAALAGACRGSDEPAPEPVPPPTAPPGTRAPWPDELAAPAILAADEVAIEGPPGLREHLALRQDEANATYVARTTPRGFLQELAARPDAGFVELRAALDAWEVVAFRRLRVLERPGPGGPVVVRGRGGAVWRRVDGSAEERGESVELVLHPGGRVPE